ncbi:Galactosylgalactosylxylosylprotein 3-beta-glucuronosyltransferase 2 [Oryzias melastigma]|uniref:Galactosylgalactosylxylosylprotein 3-beta-glucuronosyltransferase n=1 Tax=Oryzias melastigma TaxID=30732 RepID=A0A834C442_ORYME|nr:Galactosylgalactosylxylosylprotein 3-beta-glucuronosyltransferase 2 [Oryzias melastigma]
MKSVFLSRFFILLPWILIVIIMIDIDSKRAVRSPAAGRHSRAPQAVRAGGSNHSALPIIYAITPTYTRPVQKAELTRLAHAFRQVPRFHWIVVEDSTPAAGCRSRTCTSLRTGGSSAWGCHAPPSSGNAALAWLRHHRSRRDSGVVFFADDDNTYSLELFEEMRSTQGVSVWPVGFVGGRAYERPLVSGGKVVGWYTGWRPDRPFATDMAGFAVNLQVILANPRAQFKRGGSQPGMQESDFLKQITKVSELEPKANNCTRVLVWHTRTEKPHLANEPKHRKDSVVIEV